jgi:hypothetical protein
MNEADASGSEQPDSVTATAANEGTNADTTKPEGQTPDGKETGAEPDESAGGDDDADEAAKASEAAKALAARKKTANERIAEVTRARRDAERQRDMALKDAADLRARLKEPDPATFDDLSKLNAAQVEHTLDKRALADREAVAQRASQEADTQAAEAWRERVTVFKEKATDFEQVAYSAPISEATARDIARMEEGPEVAYYLGKHPAEARALNDLSERDRAVQLGRLAGRLTQAPPPRKTSIAPTPVDAVSGKGAASGSVDPSKMSEAAYIAKRKAGWRG